ncbi:SDR family NAD(P)-dependent oxidoreductase [Pseudomonas sp. FP597]|uniref:SDR family NAD(P)-dependent oxidoreductase n=1 Tax=Pseudomonas sp. FP597 TaxID=2954096 RepID=UPI002734F682|nr:SDR family oxidoreductase [Pseudomonas sp. FP597]WLI04505.1 SDR family NAD(P)-dependent oxidoreductase [Pseudomonas sp. FP597]
MKGRVAVVSGGAGGIGVEICRKLAASGATVVVGYNSSRGQALQLLETLADTGGAHCALPMPVTDSAALAVMASEVEARYGRCDVLVNCAGTTRFVPHEDMDGLDDELFDRIFATNVRGAFAMVRALRTLLQRSDDGVVVNISSIAAVSAMGSNVAYCASKAALDNMTRSLARALAPSVRVVSVSPGLADTEFVKSLDRSWRDEQADRTPLKRLAWPHEVADAVLAVISQLTFTTGAIIPVDGGRPLN